MDLQRVPVERINPAPYNPRLDLQPGDPDYDKLKRSIDEFGLVEPLVWNSRTGTLVGGHQRYKVLLEGGVREVHAVVVDLPLEREQALNIALNKVQGDWDEGRLAALLEELTQLPEFDVEMTGFDLPDVDALIAEVAASALSEKDEEFDLEAALDREQPAATQPGEVLALGRHRLLCGDSAKPTSIRRVTEGEPVDLLFTDPPYNVDYYGGNRPQPDKARPKPSRQWSRIYGDRRTQAEYTRWLGRVLRAVRDALAPGASVYIWNGWRQFGPMARMLERHGIKVSSVITWVKETFAIGYGDYNQQSEFCLYGWREGRHHWYGPTNESTVWQVRRDPTKEYQHPTQKPLELAERAIRNSTRPGQSVLDVFLGSGTTLIAAERTGRRCRGIELDPHYCDVIVRRYIAFVGEEGVEPALAERYRQPVEAAR